MLWAKVSTAATLIIGPILDSAGAEYTGAVIGDISLSKNGATLTALASAASLTHIVNGQYTLVLTTGNTDTLGRAQFTCNKSTYQCPPLELMILPATVFDALVTNATTATGGLGDIQRMAGTALTGRDIGASVLVSVGTGAGQINTSSGKVPATVATGDDADAASVKATIGVAGVGLTGIVLPVGGLANVTAWSVAITGNITGNLSGNVGGVTGLTASDVGAIKLKTDNLPSDPADASDIASAFALVPAAVAAVITTDHGAGSYIRNTEPPTAAANAAAVLTTAMTESYAADGATFTLAQALYMLWALLSERSIASTTLTAKNLSGTAAMTFTLDSTTPTSQTRAT